MNNSPPLRVINLSQRNANPQRNTRRQSMNGTDFQTNNTTPIPTPNILEIIRKYGLIRSLYVYNRLLEEKNKNILIFENVLVEFSSFVKSIPNYKPTHLSSFFFTSNDQLVLRIICKLFKENKNNNSSQGEIITIFDNYIKPKLFNNFINNFNDKYSIKDINEKIIKESKLYFKETNLMQNTQSLIEYDYISFLVTIKYLYKETIPEFQNINHRELSEIYLNFFKSFNIKFYKPVKVNELAIIKLLRASHNTNRQDYINNHTNEYNQLKAKNVLTLQNTNKLKLLKQYEAYDPKNSIFKRTINSVKYKTSLFGTDVRYALISKQLIKFFGSASPSQILEFFKKLPQSVIKKIREALNIKQPIVYEAVRANTNKPLYNNLKSMNLINPPSK
jgi:hypothetical protein